MIDKQKLQQILAENNILQDEEVKVELLGRGERNKNYLINKKFVLRQGLMQQSDKYLEREFNWLKRIKANAPKPIFLDVSKQKLPFPFSILTYTEGEQKETWTDNQLATHAKQLANLHKTKSEFWGFQQKNKLFNIEKSFLRDVKIIAGNHDEDDKKIIKNAAQTFQKNQHLFDNLQFSLIHGDCCNSNILHHKEEINYIDWEWSTYRDNAEDLARLYYENCYCKPWSANLNNQQINFFIETYQKHHPDPTLKQRVNLWNLYWRATDYLYFKRKQLEHNPHIPKERYQNAVKELKQSL